ncbi:hypothetical protein BB559_000440 [Furculomyces boomerangus]|uniref:Uncharacterized protein n=1 Tax=Furculomyces boomerangus TaxID=61424 RepID=A0A2T9Z538_9FUNG|nr:hypothetical protein BB559_000440 [Furculomyces boomerangus]
MVSRTLFGIFALTIASMARGAPQDGVCADGSGPGGCVVPPTTSSGGVPLPTTRTRLPPRPTCGGVNPVITSVITATIYPPPTYTRTIMTEPLPTITKFIDVTVYDCKKSKGYGSEEPITSTIVETNTSEFTSTITAPTPTIFVTVDPPM